MSLSFSLFSLKTPCPAAAAAAAGQDQNHTEAFGAPFYAPAAIKELIPAGVSLFLVLYGGLSNKSSYIIMYSYFVQSKN